MDQKEVVKREMQKGALLKDLFENYPLYKKMKEYVGEREDDLSFEPLQLICPNLKCRGERTFTYNEEYSDLKISTRRKAVPSTGIRIPYPLLKYNSYTFTYKCNSCNVQEYIFLLTFGEGFVRKSGQDPNPGINIKKEVEEKLGKELVQYFKNARICEEHGLGIGAVAYYRRVIEDKINDLLDEMAVNNSEVDAQELATMIEGLKVKSTFEEKAKLVSDAIPAILKPGGHNLFRILFSKLSEGLHSKNNDDCLEIAKDLRDILEEVIHVMNTQKRVANRMSQIAKKLN